MKFSVAMCTYNGAAYVQEQLDSLTRQTRVPDELVVYDDASADDTAKIIERFARDAPFPVKLHINKNNVGSTKNFEQAISSCTGEVIALADQDDVWLPPKLARLEEALKAKPDVGLVFSDAELVDENLNPLGRTVWGFTFGKDDRQAVRRGQAVEVIIGRNNFVTGATMAFRSRFKELALPIPTETKLIHDGWLALIIASVAKIEFISEPLIQYRQHSKQQIGVQDAQDKRPARLSDSHSRVQALQNMASFYQTKIELHREVRRRLLAASEGKHENNIAAVEARITELQKHVSHFQARAKMAERRIGRVPILVRELCALRYHRYSNGFYSFAKDVFLGGMS